MMLSRTKAAAAGLFALVSSEVPAVDDRIGDRRHALGPHLGGAVTQSLAGGLGRLGKGAEQGKARHAIHDSGPRNAGR